MIEFLIGIDEVGRGPIAGPVAVCAFLIDSIFQEEVEKFSKENKLPLRDSKKLTEKMRDRWYEFLVKSKKEGKCDFSVSLVSASDIDKHGIVPAIKKALATSLKKVTSDTSVKIVLDGGLKAPSEYTNQESFIKGDELYPVISLASIVAKVSRDTLMKKYAKEFPEYGFENNAGYGTKSHYEAIQKNGLTVLHRKSFLKKLVK